MATRPIAAGRASALVVWLMVVGIAPSAPAQLISSGSTRPFVTGLIPVVGPSGSVGGVSVDAGGVLARSTTSEAARLRAARLAALAPQTSDIAATSHLRKISLRGLQEAIRQRQTAGGHYDDELQNLAGLVRAEYVFVDPEHRDIVIAGRAEPWRIDEHGQAVGRTSGLPPVQLDDLIVALRTGQAAAMDRGISCSIDPTEAGMRRVESLLASRVYSESAVARLEKALGEQQITITGVPPSSHFARVLVAADFSMKRLGMNFERSPITELPSYLAMLQDPSAPRPENAMPRWWMAPRYEAVLRDERGLAWQLRGQGVQTLSEAGFLGRVAGDGDDPWARKWAELMTAHFESLALAMPVFAELRNCMDLAVIGALVVREDLARKANCDLSLLLDERKVAIAEYPPPRRVASQASLVRKGSGWILSLSGGVVVDSWSVLEHTETSTGLADRRKAANANRREHWWWD